MEIREHPIDFNLYLTIVQIQQAFEDVGINIMIQDNDSYMEYIEGKYKEESTNTFINTGNLYFEMACTDTASTDRVEISLAASTTFNHKGVNFAVAIFDARHNPILANMSTTESLLESIM